MSAWKNPPDGKTVRRNAIPRGQQWSWWTTEMLESPAYRVLSLSAHRVIARIRLEHGRHAGKENGKLPVTFRDFHDYGIHPNSIAPAIREAEALGWIRVTQYGMASNAEFRIPNKFALTHLATDDNPSPKDDWRRIKTIEDANLRARAARKSPARYGRFRKAAKSVLRYGKRSEDGYGNRSERTVNLDTETVSLSNTETVSPSIYRGGVAESDPSLSWSVPAIEPVDLVGEFQAAGYWLKRRGSQWRWGYNGSSECVGGTPDILGALEYLELVKYTQGGGVIQYSSACGVPLWRSDASAVTAR